jgi:hypothetical protein
VADAPDWTEVVAAATRAPSIHNTQPWLFTGSEDRLEVFYDPERSLPVLDPTHRQQVISCGVAVEFAAVALRAAGLEVEVGGRVVPGCEHPDHLATVRVTGERAASAEDRALAAAIGARHTQRAAFEDRAVPSGLVDQLQAEAGAYGVWLEAVSRSDAELAVVALLNRAEEVEQGEPAYRAELEKWLRTEPGAPDGIPVEAVPGEDPATRPSNWLIRDVLVGQRVRARPRSRTTTPPADDPPRPVVPWRRYETPSDQPTSGPLTALSTAARFTCPGSPAEWDGTGTVSTGVAQRCRTECAVVPSPGVPS